MVKFPWAIYSLVGVLVKLVAVKLARGNCDKSSQSLFFKTAIESVAEQLIEEILTSTETTDFAKSEGSKAIFPSKSEKEPLMVKLF